MHIKVQDLSPVALTRKRGEEAFAIVASAMRGETIDLDLEGAEMLSRSFLDGLIGKLAEAHSLGKVVFVTSDPDALAKLGRIAAQRKVTIFSRSRLGEPKQRAVTPIPEVSVDVRPGRG
jgi:STAS-like domain of unknown function (DUF4325)